MHLTFNVCYRNCVSRTSADIFDGAENHGRGQNHSRDHVENLKQRNVRPSLNVAIEISFCYYEK